jgi:ABC-2 type transport system ATP-binding protein
VTSMASVDDFKPVLVERAASLRFTHVDFRYSPRTALILRDTSFDLEPGEILGLVGPNGAGKTTAIKLAIGFFLPTGGRIMRGALPATHPDARRTMVYLADDPLVPRRLSAREFFAFAAAARGLEEDAFTASAVREVMEFGLDGGDLDSLAANLSRGQLRKVALAAALAEPPQFLALDEPTEALDSSGRALLAQRLRQFADRGGSALLATHDREFITQIRARTQSFEVANV